VFGNQGQTVNKEMLQRLKSMTGKSQKQYDTLTKGSLKSLSFVNRHFASGSGANPIIEEEAISTKTGTTSRNNYMNHAMSRTQTLGFNASNPELTNTMETFLQYMSPDMRRIVSRITGVKQLQKEVTDILERKKFQLADGSWYFGAPASAFQKKFTLRKNTQNKLYIKSGGNIERILNQKDRM
jgi:hypothetical protein